MGMNKKDLIKQWVEENRVTPNEYRGGGEFVHADEFLDYLDTIDDDVCVECQLNKDVLIYGQAFKKVNSDGSVERIDPMSVYIQPKQEQE